MGRRDGAIELRRSTDTFASVDERLHRERNTANREYRVVVRLSVVGTPVAELELVKTSIKRREIIAGRRRLEAPYIKGEALKEMRNRSTKLRIFVVFGDFARASKMSSRNRSKRRLVNSHVDAGGGEARICDEI
jgi:hypothetical protein